MWLIIGATGGGDKCRARSAATEDQFVQIYPRRNCLRCLILCRVLSWFVDESYLDIVGFCILCFLSAVYCRFCSEPCLFFCLFLSWFETNDVKTRIRQKGASIDNKSDKVSLKIYKRRQKQQQKSQIDENAPTKLLNKPT